MWCSSTNPGCAPRRTRRSATACGRSTARWRASPGPTVVHLCFGYAHVVHNKPSGYAFLPQLADTIAQQISIEAAEPKLDLGVLADLSGKQIMLGVLDLGSAEVETAETGRRAHPCRAAARRGGASDPGAGLRHEIHAARACVREIAARWRPALRSCGGNCRIIPAPWFADIRSVAVYGCYVVRPTPTTTLTGWP